MYIIFGDNVGEVKQKHVVLELDTFRSTNGDRHTAHCLIESLPAQDFPVMQSYVQVHHDMMQAYRDQNWEYCEHAAQNLMGKWNGELDSFYQDLLARVQQLRDQPPGEDWDGTRSMSQLKTDFLSSQVLDD